MSTALGHRMDASMDAYHAKKNYEVAADAYQSAIHHITRLNEIASNALADDDINRIDDLLSDVNHIFGKAAADAWEEAR
tara:strand:+ start:41042 stop:41278 length:237 start_codon:yes stop_codon:yes gene_type:complete